MAKVTESEGAGQVAGVMNGEQKRIRDAWEKFVSTGELEEGALREDIASSWKRCTSLGVDPHLEKVSRLISADDRERRFAESEILLEVATPFIADLYESIKEMEVAVILMDRDGFVLYILSGGVIETLLNQVGVVVGQYLTEETIGTAAPTVVLATGSPFRVVAEEHFCELAKVSTCVAAPILDPDGDIIGILDITARHDVLEEHPHTYGLVLASAKAIETQLRLQSTSKELYRSYKYLRATIHSISDGLIVMDQRMNIVQLNHLASRLTGLQAGEALNSTIKNKEVLRKIRRITTKSSGFTGLEAIFTNREGEEQRVLLDAEPILDEEGGFLGVVLVLRELKRMQKLAHKIYGARAMYDFDDIIGEDEEFVKCIETLKMAARTDCPIVITGESGTGKEMFAQAIHNYSDRGEGPFIPLNCAAIPKDLLESELFGYDEGAFTGAKRGGNPGKFELADGGTIFLDEVDSMPPDMQAKLLRLIEEKRVLRLGGKSFIPVDVRVISASNKNLLERTREGVFRDDLYFRLNVVGVRLPTLRERPRDIPLLAEYFIQKYTKSSQEAERFIKPDVLETLQAYEWPGNVRELSNWVERLLTLGESNGPGQDMFAFAEPGQGSKEVAVPGEPLVAGSDAVRLDESEAAYMKKVISEAIARNGGVISRAAADLGISRATLYRKITKYGIEARE